MLTASVCRTYCFSTELRQFGGFLTARKNLTDFSLEALLDILAYGFAHSVCNIFSYLNITNLPSFAEWQPFSLFDENFFIEQRRH